MVWSKGRLFCGGFDGFIVEYDLKTLQVKSKTAVTGGAIWCLATSSDSNKLAVSILYTMRFKPFIDSMNQELHTNYINICKVEFHS